MDNDDFEKFLKQLGIDTNTLSKKPGPITRAMQAPPPGIDPDWWNEQRKAEDQIVLQEAHARADAAIAKQKADIAALRNRLANMNQQAKQDRFNSLPRNYAPLRETKNVPSGPTKLEVLAKFVITHKEDVLLGVILAVVLGTALYYLL